jgi:SpoVK/Ycf46/Vps4 family AAA+-type ATPase
VRRIGALLPPEATGTTALRNSGYQKRTDISIFEKVDHVGASDVGLLAELGAQAMPRGLRQAMAGMESEKEVIERRMVLPLTEPDAAQQYGVSPPKAVILFGPHRLLICATNSVRSLDSAFLRPGRFDCIIPIGPPDATARAAIWHRYLGPASDSVDVEALVAATEMFTPADIEFAARKGAQFGFEREIEFRRGEPAHTKDYLTAVSETCPSLTQAVLDEFSDDIALRTRL